MFNFKSWLWYLSILTFLAYPFELEMLEKQYSFKVTPNVLNDLSNLDFVVLFVKSLVFWDLSAGNLSLHWMASKEKVLID